MVNTAAVKRELDGRVGFCGVAALKCFSAIAWALMGVLAMGYYGQGSLNGDHVFGSLERDLLPAGFVGADDRVHHSFGHGQWCSVCSHIVGVIQSTAPMTNLLRWL